MEPTTPQYQEAVTLLHSLSGPDGIRASASDAANYASVFTRDAVMAGIAGLLIEDAKISDGLVRTLEQLRELQGAEGQVASNYNLRPNHPARVSFGTLVPRIDAATWYLVGVALAARAGALDPAPFRESVRSVVQLLAGLEYNGRHLMFIPPGGNWADEYVYEGYILYDQVLRAWGLRLLASTYDEPAWAEKADLIERAIEINYWPTAEGESNDSGFHSPIVRSLIDSNRVHPVASFSPGKSWDIFDLAACSLLSVSGVAPLLGSASLDWISERFLARSELPPAFHPVIDEMQPEWPALSRYFLFEFRNRPHEYHNGGIWPIWLGWLARAFVQRGRGADLDRLREIVATRIESRSDFQFHEYLNGTSGEPGGTTRMAYSATGLILLHVAPHDRLSLLTATSGGNSIDLKPACFRLASSLRSRLDADFGLQKRKRSVIGIAGESGSGKSVTALCLAAELSQAGIPAAVIHQDDYFHLPPRANHEKRCLDLGNAGPHEVNLDLIRTHFDAFRAGRDNVTAPLADYPSDRMLTQRLDFSNTRVLIAEGTYILSMPDIDIRIFLRATHDETRERRRERNRDLDDPVTERVLAIEHEIIKRQAALADVVVSPEFRIEASEAVRSGGGGKA